VGRSEKGLGPRFLIRALGFHDDRNLGRARSGRGRSHRPLVPRPCVRIRFDSDGAGAARSSAGLRRIDRWRVRSRRCISQGRVQLYGLLAAVPHARRGGRSFRRPDRHCNLRLRRGAGGRAFPEIWWGHRAARPVADHRGIRFCRQDAACQWVRFRNAVYRRRRIGTHAGGTVILCHRQRTWQSLVAGLPCPRRNRSGAGVGLFWCLGQIGAHAWQHRHCRGVRRRRSPQARR